MDMPLNGVRPVEHLGAGDLAPRQELAGSALGQLQHEVSAFVTLEQPRHGGHAGFAAGRFPGHVDWLPARLLHYFRSIDSGASPT